MSYRRTPLEFLPVVRPDDYRRADGGIRPHDVIGDIVGGFLGADATKDAAESQANSTFQAAQIQQQSQREALAEQRRQYDQTREDQAPFRDAGVESIGRLRSLLANDGPLFRKYGLEDWASDPVQQIAGNFALDEGRRAIERRAPLAGGFDSGTTLKALTRYGSDYGNQRAGESYNRFNNDQTQQFNRLASLSGVGQNATNQIGAAGANMANAVGNAAMNTGNALSGLYSNLGNAQGAAAIARGNIYGNVAGSIGDSIGNFWNRSRATQWGGGSSNPFGVSNVDVGSYDGW